MTIKTDKLFELEAQMKALQTEIVKEYLTEAKNETIKEFLQDVLSHIDFIQDVPTLINEIRYFDLTNAVVGNEMVIELDEDEFEPIQFLYRTNGFEELYVASLELVVENDVLVGIKYTTKGF